MAPCLLLGLLLWGAATSASPSSSPPPATLRTPARPPLSAPLLLELPCSISSYTPLSTAPAAPAARCLPGRGANSVRCGRHVSDGQVASREEAAALLAMMRRAFARSRKPDDSAGPTLADINSGLLRDSESGVVRLFRGAEAVHFSAAEFGLYRTVFERARAEVARVFGLDDGALFFTAPTFVTRIKGSADYVPEEIHDEYWHPHVDKLNTEHYDYSGLLYLSESGIDFEGGDFGFVKLASKGEAEDEVGAEARVRAQLEDGPASGEWLWDADHVVEPAPGRFVAFTAGQENVHHVAKVTAGERFVLSMWFTCDARRRFKAFLDGEEHRTFERGPVAAGAATEAAAPPAPPEAEL